MADYKAKIIELLKDSIFKTYSKKLNESDVAQLIEMPKDISYGDFAYPCFNLAKVLKKNPAEIAKNLADSIKIDPPFQKVIAAGAYVNFFLDKAILAEETLKNAVKDDYGKTKTKPERVMIEFCQANTHKPFHVGHLRNVCLGDSLVRLYRFQGHKVTAANYQGDIGAHVAKCLWGLNKFHQKEKPTQHKGEWLGNIYAEANALSEDNEENKKEISEVLQKLENNDAELTKLWKETRKWCLDEFEIYYAQLGVKFDRYFFESEFEKPGKEIVKEVLKKKVAEESEGAIIVDLRKYNLDVFVILKSDGTALYSTKDLALAKKKFEEFDIERSIYVVGSEQKFYFQQLFKVLELMGFPQAKKCFHLSYELVMLKEGKMSSREGNVVLYRTLYEEMIKKAIDEVEKRHQDWERDKQKMTAGKIALAAMKFGMLNQDNNKVIVFDMAKAVDFEGETGPYIQYAIARINSIFRKYGKKLNEKIDYSLFKKDEELILVKLLLEFPSIIEKSIEQNKPMILSIYLLQLTKAFNIFYHTCQILKEVEELKNARLVLISAVKNVLEKGLDLLGIPALEEM